MTPLEVLDAPITVEDRMLVLLHEEVIPAATLRLLAVRWARGALEAERAAGREPAAASWDAVDVAERYARGEATDAELAAARVSARAAAGSAARTATAEAAADAAAEAAAWALNARVRAAASGAATHAARAAAWSTARDTQDYAAWSAARDAASSAQLADVRRVLTGGGAVIDRITRELLRGWDACYDDDHIAALVPPDGATPLEVCDCSIPAADRLWVLTRPGVLAPDEATSFARDCASWAAAWAAALGARSARADTLAVARAAEADARAAAEAANAATWAVLAAAEAAVWAASWAASWAAARDAEADARDAARDRERQRQIAVVRRLIEERNNTK